MASNITRRWLLAVIGLAIIAGCTSAPVRVEADYGNSARRMVSAQLYDPQAPHQPDKAPNGDAQKADSSLEQYRGDVAQAAKNQKNLSLEQMLPISVP